MRWWTHTSYLRITDGIDGVGRRSCPFNHFYFESWWAMQALFLYLAVFLLPQRSQARFHSEWRSELLVIENEIGRKAATGYAVKLVGAAPRMMMEMRSNSPSAYVELSVASLLAVIPAIILGVLAVIFQVWIMLVAQLFVAVGAILVASGFWHHDGRLLDSGRARIGLVVFLLASAAGTAIIRLTELGPRVDEQVNSAFPNMVVLFGLVLLAASNYSSRLRRRIQLVAVAIIGPGAALGVVAAVINAAAVSGAHRLVLLIYVLPASVLAWACYSIVGRPQVFDDVVPVEV